MGAVLAMRGPVFLHLALALLGLTLGLAGCQTQLQKISGQKAPAPVPFSAEVMAGPAMQAALPDRGAQAILFPVAVNQDVETWLAVDNISVSFRQGVLVASRGLGADLMGADVTGTLAALGGQAPPVYRRQMRFLTGDHRTTYMTAGCSMTVAEKETVAGRPTQRLEERCEAQGLEFTNLFWVDGAGHILRARQWVSPDVGYLESWILDKPIALTGAAPKS